MTRRVCVVTGSRAEYGLLRGVLDGLRDADDVALQLAVTGMHLSPEFGLTYREIEGDGFTIDARVETLLSSDTPVGVAKAIGLGVIGFADAFARLAPDIVVLLGDRFEILAAATAALVAGIPVAHIHGGETTEAAFDEAIRHSLTKMSHLHFVAAAPYRERVIQLGENPSRVHLVGGLGVDAIRRIDLLDRAEVDRRLDFTLGERSLLITFHPATLDAGDAAAQVGELLAALDALGPDVRLVFTMPNADTGGREIAALVDAFVAGHDNARSYVSLGQLLYLSCLAQVDGVVGNSSSGLLEAPTLGIGTVNIGDRQAGRLRAASVIDCAPDSDAIGAALARLLSEDFRNELAGVISPFGTGGASAAIVRTVREHPLDGLTRKCFYDVSTGLASALGEGSSHG